MVLKILITRKTPAQTVPALVSDAFVELVRSRITEIYKLRKLPTTPAAVEQGLKATFQTVSSKAMTTDYIWMKNPITCHSELICIGGTEISIADGANDPVLVRIQDEITIV